jgi:hypothetical protein
MTRVLIAAALVNVLALQQAPPPPPAPPASIAGKWSVSADIVGNASESVCDFTQKEAVLSGTCTANEAPLAITGKVDGKTVSWQFNTEYGGQPLTVAYSGTIETPEKITGGVDVSPFNVQGTFVAVKAK